MASITADHQKVLSQLDRLQQILDGPEERARLHAPAVSGWTPLAHVEHLCRAGGSVLGAIDQAEERAPGEGPSLRLIGRFALAVGWLPRGAGKAPAVTKPEGLDLEAVGEDLAAFRTRAEALAPRLADLARARGRTPHPVFGGLTPAQWMRFLVVHHHHHMKIIRDIEKAAG